MFQNCKPSSQDNQFGLSGLGNPYGVLITYLESDESKTLSDHFDVDTQIAVQFQGTNPKSKNYDWTVQEGFESIASLSQTTNQPATTMSFDQDGLYDIQAEAYQSGTDQTPLSFASKRLSIGTCQQTESSVLEIELEEGSLKAGDVATFGLIGDSALEDIRWKIDEGLPLERESIEVDLVSKQAGNPIQLEVEATDPNGCTTYRRKRLFVTKGSQPYFNFVKPADDNYPVILENNDIYKYKRSSNSTDIHVSISGAKRCEWKNGGSFSNCENGRLPLKSQSTTKCTNSQEVINAFYDVDEVENSIEKYYYIYCPANDAICYFGPSETRPNEHSCVSSTALPSTGEDARGPASIESPDPVESPTASPEESPEASTTPTDSPPVARSVACGSDEYINFSSCNVDNPSRSSCSQQSSGCYAWTCDDGYTLNNGSCVALESSSTTSTTSPSQPQCTCNNSQNNGCGNGCSAVQRPADTGSLYRWTCTRNGYTNSGTCSISKPQCTCNNSQNNGCGNGCSAVQNPADTGSLYRWTCTRNGYTNSGTCSISKPQCTCNNSQNNGCGMVVLRCRDQPIQGHDTDGLAQETTTEILIHVAYLGHNPNPNALVTIVKTMGAGMIALRCRIQLIQDRSTDGPVQEMVTQIQALVAYLSPNALATIVKTMDAGMVVLRCRIQLIQGHDTDGLVQEVTTEIQALVVYLSPNALATIVKTMDAGMVALRCRIQLIQGHDTDGLVQEMVTQIQALVV